MTVTDAAWGDAERTERNVRRVYHLCHRMTLDADQAAAACVETFQRASVGKGPGDERALELWLLKIAAHVLEARLPPAPEVTFDLLDETLRSEATRNGEVSSLSDPEREFLLWELKQGCMTAVVNCLAQGERVAFVAACVLGLPEEDAALALGITPSALKVRLSRARKKIGDYLAPRCGHVDPRNPCQCQSRIGVAVRNGFISPPSPSPQLEAQLRRLPPFSDGKRHRDAVGIYGTLPEPEPPSGLLQRIMGALRSGRWDAPSS